MAERVDTKAARSSLEKLRLHFDTAVERAMQDAVDAGVSHARTTRLFNDRTGETRASVQGLAGATTGRIVAGGAAKFLENGSVHPEQSGKLWRFVVNGEVIFTRKIKAYTVAARPFMAQARDHAILVFEHAVNHYLTTAVEEHNRG